MEQPNDAKADAGRRYRAYPTPAQAERLTGWGHSCRAVWNLALAQRQYLYRHRGCTLRAVEQCAHLTQARAELPWLADLPAQSAQQVLRHLDRAYDNWWNPQHPAGPPTFNKRSDRLVVPFPGQVVKIRTLNRRWADVRLPKVGWVRLRLSRPLGGAVRNATLRRDGLGWHVSFGVATGAAPAAPNGLLRAKLDDLHSRQADRLESDVLNGLDGPDVADLWPALPLSRRRAIIGIVVPSITVGPASRPGSPVFEPERVDVPPWGGITARS